MKIGFDVSQTAERMMGCGTVADQFLRHLVPAAPGETFIPYPVFGDYRNPAFARATRPEGPNVVTSHFAMTWDALNKGWDRDGDIREFLREPDVVHVNNFSCPRNVSAPVVYTVYDMSPIECPEFHTEANRLSCFNGLFEASLRARHFVAISESTRSAFLRWFPHVAAERVTVVHLAARPSLTAPVTDARAEAVLRKFDLAPDAFWLTVGTIEPRKNYAQLLEAYAAVLAASPGHDVPLCIAGQAGWIESSLEPRIRQLGIGDRVRCLGFVDDEELAVLYRRCLAFLYPSLYEGFGLPVVEAMACGAAVVAMRTTSLPEVVGDAGLLVDPRSPGGWAAAMAQLADDDARLADLRAAARARAACFSWSAAAESLLAVYRSVVTEA